MSQDNKSTLTTTAVPVATFIGALVAYSNAAEAQVPHPVPVPATRTNYSHPPAPHAVPTHSYTAPVASQADPKRFCRPGYRLTAQEHAAAQELSRCLNSSLIRIVRTTCDPDGYMQSVGEIDGQKKRRTVVQHHSNNSEADYIHDRNAANHFRAAEIRHVINGVRCAAKKQLIGADVEDLVASHFNNATKSRPGKPFGVIAVYSRPGESDWQEVDVSSNPNYVFPSDAVFEEVMLTPRSGKYWLDNKHLTSCNSRKKKSQCYANRRHAMILKGESVYVPFDVLMRAATRTQIRPGPSPGPGPVPPTSTSAQGSGVYAGAGVLSSAGLDYPVALLQAGALLQTAKLDGRMYVRLGMLTGFSSTEDDTKTPANPLDPSLRSGHDLLEQDYFLLAGEAGLSFNFDPVTIDLAVTLGGANYSSSLLEETLKNGVTVKRDDTESSNTGIVAGGGVGVGVNLGRYVNIAAEAKLLAVPDRHGDHSVAGAALGRVLVRW